MKKFFATLMVCIIFLNGCVTMTASATTVAETEPQENDIIAPIKPEAPETFEEMCEDASEESAVFYFTEKFICDLAVKDYEATGEKLTWTICNLKDHKGLKTRIFYDKADYQEIEGSLMGIGEESNVVGIYGVLPTEVWNDVEEILEKESLEETLKKIVLPMDEAIDEEKILEKLNSEDAKIRWSTRETQNSEIFIVNVWFYVSE